MGSREKSAPSRYWGLAFFFFGFSLFLLSANLKAESSSGIYIDESTQMGLADHFFQEGEYERAITEYKRFLFLFTKSVRTEEALFKVAQSYFNGKKWDDAVFAGEQLLRRFPETSFKAKALFLLGLSFRDKKDYPQARYFFEKTQTVTGDSALADEAQKQIAFAFLREEKWKEAAWAFRQMDPKGPLQGKSEIFAQGLDRIQEIPQKSPALAGVLAALIPGSGHLYVERYRDAPIAFLLNGAFIWGIIESFERKNYVVGGILAFFELGWYSGNIYSAVSSAHKYNRQQRKDYLDRLERQSQLSVGITFQGSRPMVFLDYRF